MVFADESALKGRVAASLKRTAMVCRELGVSFCGEAFRHHRAVQEKRRYDLICRAVIVDDDSSGRCIISFICEIK